MHSDRELRQQFLNAMSQAACTVSVVTTDGPAGRAGVTVSAMASVSADAEQPSLLVCVHHLSPAAAAILDNGVFCVNVLRDNQSLISDVFAGRVHTESKDKFSVATWTTQATGAPHLVDALVAFDCTLFDAVQVATHHILVGSVGDIFIGNDGSPLIYAGRTYGTTSPLDNYLDTSAGHSVRG